MSNIRLGESSLTNVKSLKVTDAFDETKYHIFYDEQKAILNISAPAGSTIDILQNSIVLQTYTLGASETTHEFRVSVSATQYTVRATLDTKTASKNVLVEQGAIYTVKLVYKLYLYNNGDQCTDVTGGWISHPTALTSASWDHPRAATFNSDHIVVNGTGSGYSCAISTVKWLNFSGCGYTTLVFEGETSSNVNTRSGFIPNKTQGYQECIANLSGDSTRLPISCGWASYFNSNSGYLLFGSHYSGAICYIREIYLY